MEWGGGAFFSIFENGEGGGVCKGMRGDCKSIFLHSRVPWLCLVQCQQACPTGKLWMATCPLHLLCIGVQGFFDTLRMEIADTGVNILSVCPGPVESKSYDAIFTTEIGKVMCLCMWFVGELI